MDNDYLSKIGIPKIEYIDLTFLLEYKVYEYSTRPFSSIWKLDIKIESVHIDPKDYMRSRLISISYETSNYFKEYLLYEHPKWKIGSIEMANRIAQGRNKIIALLVAPLEMIPLHINDPDPYNELAAWRLMLPKLPSKFNQYSPESPLLIQ
jgi:hypothetical protein